ncbi:MAG: hypothetical protein RIB46_18660 [Pseudomonadales bacterium]
MKTTIEIADDLADAARRMARRRRTTLRAVIEEGIRLAIREQDRKAVFQLRDASVSGRGLQPEFAEGDERAILDAAYAGRGGDRG